MSSLRHPPLPHCQPPDLKDVRGMEAISGRGITEREAISGRALRDQDRLEGIRTGWKGLGQAGRD